MKQGLIFTGSKITGELIIEMLRESFYIKQVENFQELLDSLLSDEKKYDFLIIDRTLKDLSAKDIFSKLIQSGIESIPPSILLTQSRYNPVEDGEGYAFILRKPFYKQEIIEAVNFALLSKNKKKLEKILMVDDSRTSRNIMKRILTSHGYKCFEAENATEGLKKAEEISPDLIIVDYVMPDFNGIELAQKISKNEKLKKIPIILITGSQRFNEVIEEGFNSGISAYFKKPFNESEVVGFLKRYFHNDESSKILLIEDSFTRRKVIYSSLSINNNQVISVENLEKAKAFLEDNRFDLILMDLILNNETAFDGVKIFRKVNKNIPIIVYSSIADRKNIYKILELGASDYLWAPIEMRELILKVNIWLGYSKFINFKNKIDTIVKRENIYNDFMEFVDANLSRDKLNGIISSLVCLHLNKDDDKILQKINEILRKDDKAKFFRNKFFIYLSGANLILSLKICKRIKNSIGIDVDFGIVTTDSVGTVEELFEKAEKNIIKL